jgi:isoquinoline 1-oxidoreductase beta subunit
MGWWSEVLRFPSYANDRSLEMKREQFLNRRRFLVGSAAIVGGTAFQLVVPWQTGRAAAKEQSATEVNAWIVVGADNSVTFRIPQTEIGQGTVTTISQLLGEELSLNPAAVRTEFYDATANILRNNVYPWTATLSSLSADLLFKPARIAAAQVRMLLLQAASRDLKVPVEELEIEDAHVHHRPKGKAISFAALAPRVAALPIPDPEHVQLRPPSQWRYIGQPIKRLDAKAKVDGSTVYGIDVRLPNMKFAAICNAPVFGGRLKSLDPASVQSHPGVRAVVKVKGGRSGLNEPPDHGADDWGMDDSVAVIADSWWQAHVAIGNLKVEWEAGRSGDFGSEWLQAEMTDALDRGGTTRRSNGDATAAITRAKTALTAEYWFPFMEPAPLEPMNCTAWLDQGELRVWAPTQFPDEAVRIAAYASGVPIERVHLHLTYAGGGFGRRINSDFISQAAQIARQLPGVPVKLLWSREECIRKSYYPAPAAARFRGGLDEHGNLTAWVCTAVFAKKFDQSYAAARIAQLIPNTHVEVTTVESPVPFGWMRGVAWTQLTWMTHSFLDELAHAAGRDVVEFQLSLLQEDSMAPAVPARDYEVTRLRRQRRVLTEAARLAGWGEPLGPGKGRGLAASDMSYTSSYAVTACASIAEVTLDGHGWFRIDRVVIVMDCGTVINPDVVAAQMEGGVAWAASNAMYSEITLDHGAVAQSNFHNYPILRIDEMPRVETHILASDYPPTGVGEEAVPVTIGAIVNAIHAAGGPRIRRLPIVRAKPFAVESASSREKPKK